MLTRFAANPEDAEAAEALRRAPEFVGTTRTTCVATMLDAGHAQNALPQRASAVVNCRIFPGIQPEAVRQALVAAIGNEAVRVETMGDPQLSPVSEPRAEVDGRDRRLDPRRYPGVADLALSGIGRHRRPHLPQRRHPDLGELGHLHPARRDVRPRPQRAHPGGELLRRRSSISTISRWRWAAAGEARRSRSCSPPCWRGGAAPRLRSTTS